MSLLPQNENELVIHRTDVEPIDPKDERSTWEKFIDILRKTIGLKPLYLAERWSEAKVRQEEVDADSRLLAAKAEYELAMAEVRKIEVEMEGKFAKDMAEADLLRAQANALNLASNRLVSELFNSKTMSPEEAVENLRIVIEKIRLHGGNIEIDFPELPE